MHTTTILICFFIFLVQVSTMDAHTDKYVRTLCGKTAIRNIANLCPPKPEMKGICSTGEYPSITEYCSMGFSDSQIKFMCCDNQ
ncbi:putative insulin-like peptide alpha-type 2 [Caenorhabditis elegans]|uniref:Probable insulin-like peptide alpha-type 2 n=1 Tax=Caenorhabditis elegans TaxID=6239 RepID=ILA2_CAEEL|nr:putative insulin-like peptide alpha-type 2 [Caenorhabditis elegans]Q21508.1 RecName: Full=Probable insulin-like peptide alpha-type 2; Flags: Precursor [Caenorhabditis elegans]CAA83611.1 Probable insulin-like peptide alpha-type 2 [Caenorhabditis elegans]|eukprot:NP_499223.1 Probable insulin-like peptide alpha-type 2 [Caenorhabditis elegans]